MSSQETSARRRPEEDSSIDVPESDEVPGASDVPDLVPGIGDLRNDIWNAYDVLKEESGADPRGKNYTARLNAAQEILRKLDSAIREIDREFQEALFEFHKEFETARELAEKVLADDEYDILRAQKVVKEPEGDEPPQLQGGEFEKAMKQLEELEAKGKEEKRNKNRQRAERRNAPHGEGSERR